MAAVKFDLVGRRCIVTGATSGIGKEVARNLAYFGATVVLAGRNRDRGSAALQEIAEDSGNDRITFLQVDLSAQDSIRQFARHVRAGGAPVHVLVNNAGTYVSTRAESAEGHELTFATNTLGYFMLTNLLLPTMAKNGPARVVNVASKLAGKLDVEDLGFERRKYSGARAYAQSKQANRMLSWGLHERLAQVHADISVHACHPGGVATGIYDHTAGALGKILRWGRRFMKTPAEGALTPTLLAADPIVHAQGNQFWISEKPAPCKFRDRDHIDQLWNRCVEMTHTDATPLRSTR